MSALRNRPVTVIGAGIGGLTAALALARRGAQVTVLERAPELGEVGAGSRFRPMRCGCWMRLASEPRWMAPRCARTRCS
ncbi:FAD-dependent oxidoreductase [Paracoccus marcusii]|uniref:FAD-dependent oxidoreductase n=1 Tax=Paracoccus marcusii TaxID=59779 RepID=UPI002ED39F87|nr:FAD-dependent oxidoreductase [Paracoccus marcusii]